MSEPDYYRLLGVSKEAPERDVKKAYYEHARKLHPDKAGNPQEAEANAKTLAQMSKAYNTLKDPKKREEYDATIKGKPSAPITPTGPASQPGTGGASGGNVAASSTARIDTASQKRNMAQKAFVKGMQLYKVQNYKEAKGFFEVAVANDPESEPQYHLKYSQTLMKIRSSFSKAVEHAEIACEMDPYNVEFKIVLATLYESAGVNSKAIELYQQVLKWDGSNSQAKNRLNMMGVGDDSKNNSFFDKLRKKLNMKK